MVVVDVVGGGMVVMSKVVVSGVAWIRCRVCFNWYVKGE